MAAPAESKTETLRTLYPPFEPFNTGHLPVDDVHKIYYEESGNPEGKPVVVLHGGPGGGSQPSYRQFFDPKVWRVIQFDQRGCGKSLPLACLKNNTTWHLVEDIEKLRQHLKIDKWVVFGGSWGSCLSLAYAQTHTERVKALILRGIFTLRRKELIWFYQEGASYIFPDFWEEYLAPIPLVERGDLMSAYYRRLTGEDEEEKKKCGAAWTKWEMATSRLIPDPTSIAKAAEDEFAVTFARIECHYFVNGGFFKYDGQLIEEATKLKNIPGVIVQGRYDVVCPAYSAWDLHKKVPHMELKMCQDAGHSVKEARIAHELVLACEKFASL